MDIYTENGEIKVEEFMSIYELLVFLLSIILVIGVFPNDNILLLIEQYVVFL